MGQSCVPHDRSTMAFPVRVRKSVRSPRENITVGPTFGRRFPLSRFSAGKVIRISPPELRPAILSKRSLSANISGRVRIAARIPNCEVYLLRKSNPWVVFDYSDGLAHPTGKTARSSSGGLNRCYAVFDCLSVNKTSGGMKVEALTGVPHRSWAHKH